MGERAVENRIFIVNPYKKANLMNNCIAAIDEYGYNGKPENNLH